MKTKTYKISLILVVLIAPLMLFGCKQKCPRAGENIPGTSTFREDCPYEEQASNDEKKEINFYFLHDNTDAYREQIQSFQSKHPGVMIKTKKFVNIDEYEDLLINEIAEGEGPDVFMIHNSWITKHWKKLLPMPLDTPIIMNPDLFRQTFFQAAADDLVIDEKIYGLPLAMDNLAIYYNKQHYKDLLATTDHPGNLWSDIKDEVFQLTKKNNSPERFALSGMAMGRSDNVSSAVDILYALMMQYGVEFYDEKGERATFANKTGVGFDELANPGVAALTLFTSFAQPSYKHYSWNENMTGFSPADKEVNPFVRGKVSMIVGYPYLYDSIIEQIRKQQKFGNQHIDEDDIGIAAFPQLTSDDEATERHTLASYFPLVVARTSEYPDLAWALTQHLTTMDSLQSYHKKTNRPTSRKDMVAEQQTEKAFGVFAAQANFAKSLRILDAQAYHKVFSDAIDQVVRNTHTPKEALEEAQTKITCVVQKYRKIIEPETDCHVY